MSKVRVYDIASSTWKTQKAVSKNGDSPRARRDFCAVAMSAQDHSSHQIYFYGGYPYGPPTISPLDDLWVLTLPSFQFIRVSNSLEAQRASGTCSIISPRYLLAYRGESFEGSDRINALLNASLALLDLTDLEWKTEYTPANTSTVYKVPRKVIEMIGGEYVLFICSIMRRVYSYHLAKLAMQQPPPQLGVLTTNPLLQYSTFQISQPHPPRRPR